LGVCPDRRPRLATGAARRHGATHIVLTEHPAAAEAVTYSPDQLHLSARGHAVVAAETVRVLHGVEGVRRIA